MTELAHPGELHRAAQVLRAQTLATESTGGFVHVFNRAALALVGTEPAPLADQHEMAPPKPLVSLGAAKAILCLQLRTHLVETCAAVRGSGRLKTGKPIRVAAWTLCDGSDGGCGGRYVVRHEVFRMRACLRDTDGAKHFTRAACRF